jgi:hypothetical protein
VLPDEDLQAIDDLLAERDTALAGYRPTGGLDARQSGKGSEWKMDRFKWL